MNRRKLERYLKEQGCFYHHHGGGHDAWWNPSKHLSTVIPRHTDIDTDLARTICKQLGVPPPPWR